jgi:plastocyanin
VQRHGTFAFLAAMALLLGGLGARAQIHAPIASAAQSWDVQVGGDPSTPGMTAINFYPSALTINAGDTVNFNFPAQEPHTVTFDAGHVPGLFLTGITPNSPGPGDLDITAAFSPVNASGPIASYDGTQVVSSGVPVDPPGQRAPFAVVFPKEGVYYFECAVHGPLMSGTITVGPASSTLTETPAAAKTRGAAEFTRNLTYSSAFADTFAINSVGTSSGSNTIHTATAGAPGDHFSFQAYVPSNLTVKRGDYVTWSQPDPTQFHTVTFLVGTAAPPVPKLVINPGGPPTLLLSADVMVPSGGDTFTGAAPVNSGTLTPGNSVTLKIDAPPGTYEYECLFHADDYNMRGTITVTP